MRKFAEYFFGVIIVSVMVGCSTPVKHSPPDDKCDEKLICIYDLQHKNKGRIASSEYYLIILEAKEELIDYGIYESSDLYIEVSTCIKEEEG